MTKDRLSFNGLQQQDKTTRKEPKSTHINNLKTTKTTPKRTLSAKMTGKEDELCSPADIRQFLFTDAVQIENSLTHLMRPNEKQITPTTTTSHCDFFGKDMLSFNGDDHFEEYENSPAPTLTNTSPSSLSNETTDSILENFLNEETEINFNILEELREFEEYLNNEFDNYENNYAYYNENNNFNEENPITCAKVILNRQGLLIYVCNLCKDTDQEFVNVANYQEHLATHHPKVHKSKNPSATQIDDLIIKDLDTRNLWINDVSKMDKMHYECHNLDFLEQLDKAVHLDELNNNHGINSEHSNANSAKNLSSFLFNSNRSSSLPKSNNNKTNAKLKKKKRTPGYCEICQRSFNDLYNLRVHMMIHTGEMPYQCEDCGKRFRQLNKLNIHRIIHTNNKPFTCDICGKGFRFRNYLAIHKRLHSGEKPYKCKYCDEYYHSLHMRRQHMKTKHDASQTYRCNECDRVFTAPCYLKSHMKRHQNQRDYPCNICSKSFYSLSQLKDHKLSHTDWKPYHCDICNAKFQRKSNFNQHLKIHSNVKSYICQICNKAFAQNAGLYGHMKAHHKT